MNNLMMDADKLYPEGFHPVSIDRKPDRTDFAKYTENARSKRVTGRFGRDRDPPELAGNESYDPFGLGIFIIGNVLKVEYQEVMMLP